MEQLKYSLGSVWNCNICSQPCKDIYVLPCQHKFCQKCLQIWVGVYTDTYRPGHQQFPCRICWQINYIPKKGLDAYHQNFDMCQLELDLNNLNMHTDDNITESNPFHPVNSVGVLSPAQLDTINRTNINYSNEPMNQQQLHSLPAQNQQPSVNNMKISSSSAPLMNNSTFTSDSNDIDMTTSSLNVVDNIPHGNQEEIGYRTPIRDLPIAESDRMIQRTLCFPGTCNMYHMF